MMNEIVYLLFTLVGIVDRFHLLIGFLINVLTENANMLNNNHYYKKLPYYASKN